MSEKRIDSDEQKRIDSVNWRQRLYIFGNMKLSYEVYFFGEELLRRGGPETETPMHDFAKAILRIEGVTHVLFSGYGMTIFKEDEYVWEEIEEGLAKVIRKTVVDGPIYPHDIMGKEWKLIDFGREYKEAGFLLTGKKLMYYLHGRRFTRQEWQEAVEEDKEGLKFDLRPLGFPLVEKIFANTEAVAVIIMDSQVYAIFENEVGDDLKKRVEGLIREVIKETE